MALPRALQELARGRARVISLFNPARAKQASKKLAAGDVDVIIGTHRLPSKDVQFDELRSPDRERRAPLRRSAEGEDPFAALNVDAARDEADADSAHAAWR
ncbi:MAG: hypothetical protein IPK53_17555 [bacterium]|nr:hypothetical protein [bacterium]